METLSHETPSLRSACIFSVKATVLRMRRRFFSATRRPKKFSAGSQLADAPLLAESLSELWTSDTEQNRILTAGKVQNLRIAAQKLDGLVVPANAVFSFWAQIGKPSRCYGFVQGRELREGCIIPSIGGGLCQISNALYDAALTAGFEIVERHAHSVVIPGSLAEKGRDATVFWNYVDLRFRAPHAFRIEAELSESQLSIRLRGIAAAAERFSSVTAATKVATLEDCLTCGKTSCFRHETQAKAIMPRTAWLLDDYWPEYDLLLRNRLTPQDWLFIPQRRNSPRSWPTNGFAQVRTARLRSFERSVRLRWVRPGGRFLQTVLLRAHERFAQTFAKKLIPEITHLVVSQNLLPFLQRDKILGGRSYEVLMTRLPLRALHERLDAAFNSHPESSTLPDFRAPQELVDAEETALQHARRIITPHPEVAALFPGKAVLLGWSLGERRERTETGSEILFAASALGRKGAYEMRTAARELGVPITVLGKATESESFWGDVQVKAFAGNWKNIRVVVLPAFVEHQPRFVLRAIALGIPVIVSKACGLENLEDVSVITAGDTQALIDTMRNQLRETASTQVR